MDIRQSLDGRAVLLMLVLCMIWGLQQSVLKLTQGDIAPIMQIALRSGASALLVALLMWWRGEPLLALDVTWRPGMLVGGLFALEFLLVGEGLRHTTASHMVVFLYTAPVFVALGLHFKLPAERLNALQWAGITLAFAGLTLAFLGPAPHAASASGMNSTLWGDALGLLGGMAWAATTVVVRSTALSRASASQTLLYQLVAAFVLLLVVSVTLGQHHINPTPWVLGSLLFQSLVVSFASFLVWFWLLRHYLASQLGAFSFMTPLFGVGFGVWLLGEPLEPRFVLGAVGVIAGVILVSSHAWLRHFHRVKSV